MAILPAKSRQYQTSMCTSDGIHELVRFTLSNKETFRSRIRSIVLGHNYEKANNLIQSLRRRAHVQRVVLEEIYYPVIHRVGVELITNEPFCVCHAPVCRTRYSFGSFENGNCGRFRLEEEIIGKDGSRHRHIIVDIRHGNEKDRLALVNEIVQKHESTSWKDGTCEVLGRNEIKLCQTYVSELKSLLDTLEEELKSCTCDD